MFSGDICSLLFLKNSKGWNIFIQNIFLKFMNSYYVKADGTFALLKGDHSLLKLKSLL